jgi:DNA helicase HerA-like ATPase
VGVVILKSTGVVGWLMSEEDAHELRDLVDEILETPQPKQKNKIKAKGLFLGERRDTGEIVQIDKMVLARHAAMLGSTGSGKTVMAKTVIEEAALAGIPSLILDPQGDLARLALAINEGDLIEQGGDVARMKKLMS